MCDKNTLINYQIGKIANLLLLNGTLIECPGLIYGKTGIAIFFFHYAQYTSNEIFEEYAMDIINSIREQIYNQSIANYERGIAGIGIGIHSLIEQEFLDADNDLFDDFDQRMYQTVICEPCINFSLYKGVVGYGQYWLHRYKNNKQVSTEALILILDKIYNNIELINDTDKSDIFFFLTDLLRHQSFEFYSKLINQFSPYATSTVSRLNSSTFKNINANDDFVNELLTEKVSNNGKMGIYDGYAGKGLFLLSLINKNKSWKKLL